MCHASGMATCFWANITGLTENEVNFTFQPSVVLGSIKLPLSGQDVPSQRYGDVFQSKHHWSTAYLPKMG